MGGTFAYYRYTVGIIGPDEIYPEALGLSKEQIERHLGKPRRHDDFGNGAGYAFWKGREPYSWSFSIWYVRDVAVHVRMPNDLVGLELQDVIQRVGPTVDWQIGSITYLDNSYRALTNENRSVVVYDDDLGYHAASKDSIFWE